LNELGDEGVDGGMARKNGRRLNVKRWFGIGLSLLVILVNYSPPVQLMRALPDVLHMTPGQEHKLNLGIPLNVSVEEDGAAVLASGDETLGDVMRTSINLAPGSTGESYLHFSLLGLLPVKNIQVQVQPERILVPGGQAIGVALQTSGVLVVGTSDLSGGQEPNPARQAGIKPGDLIHTVNGDQIESATHLALVVNENGAKPLRIGVERQDQHLNFDVQPAIDRLDGNYRLGIWVRDSTAGVGTLSFYDPKDGSFGALGHAITDIDTGMALTVAEGQILQAQVVDVQRGERGTPGELKGSFLKDKIILGSITKNNVFGIYGAMGKPIEASLYPQGLPVGARSMVHPGKATILSTVEGGQTREYEIEIVRCTPQNKAAQKGIVIKVTDPQLLSKTGGIVQGMSGSPILQDGCIVGVVTHVYVNDPTHGYGMYIDWMLEQTAQDSAA